MLVFRLKCQKPKWPMILSQNIDDQRTQPAFTCSESTMETPEQCV